MRKLYLIGDSISIQYGPHLGSYLRGVAEFSRKGGEEEALLNLDRPQGANGGDSSRVLEFLLALEKAGGIEADILLLNCGLHDIKTDTQTLRRQVTIEEYDSNLRKIIATTRRMGVSPIWISTTPCDEKAHNRPGMEFHRFARDCTAYNEVADRIMRSEGVPVIDLFAFTANLGDDIYCDHVHFHEHVREKQGAFIAGWLGAFLSVCPPDTGSPAG